MFVQIAAGDVRRGLRPSYRSNVQVLDIAKQGVSVNAPRSFPAKESPAFDRPDVIALIAAHGL
ncbi:hypothetical protein [Rhizobium sp. NXC24]|uniref:hypothetical protein n=1 Tax=Rhizobium sp. NXC24 TaxID=2048897 RepID=UPI000CDF3B8D|nr:hypothetical protein [Rhizobium sp. NXC24]AVA22243.1 hypothetical protein NXC24_CH02610 [Rhizobium sp. NXC24]